MFDRLHQNAREAVVHARAEATRAGQRAVGAEHLLLGVLARPSHAADALTAAGADADELRAHMTSANAARPEPLDAGAAASVGIGSDPAERAADAASGGGPPDGGGKGQRGGLDVSDDIPMARDANRALELARRAAQRLRHEHVSSGHLLLGIIDQPGTPAVQALAVAGIHVGMLRADLLRRMTEGSDPYAG